MMRLRSKGARRTGVVTPQFSVGRFLRESLGLSIALLCFPELCLAATSTTTTTSADYDLATGLQTKSIVEPGDSSLCLVTEYHLDSYGRRSQVTTRNCNGSAAVAAGAPSEAPAPAPTLPAAFASRPTTYTFSTDQRFVATVTNALTPGQVENRAYDPRFGILASSIGPNSLATTWAFDALGRKTLETRPDGTKIRYDYVFCTNPNPGSIFNWPATPAGAVSASCPSVAASSSSLGTSTVWPVYYIQSTPLAPNGSTAIGAYTRTYRDTLGRDIRTESQGFDGGGGSQIVFSETQYDRAGNVVANSQPYTSGVGQQYWSGYVRDALGRTTQIYEGNASGGPATTRLAYSGLTSSVTDPRGFTTTQTKNVAGQRASSSDGKGGLLRLSYDPIGNLVQTIDAKGNVASAVFDVRSRKTSFYDPDMGIWNYAYNAAGDVVKQTDAKLQVATLEYDRAGRLTKRIEPDLISTWFYDANADGTSCGKGKGKLCEATTDNGYDRKHVYDSLGRPSTTTVLVNSASYVAALGYDATTGRVSSQTYPTGVATSTVYTPLGYPWKVVDSRTGTAIWTANSLNAAGDLLTYTYGNGVVTTNSYYLDGRINTTQAGSGNSVQSLSYGYDLNRNVAVRIDVATGVSASYGYDELNRLTSESRSGGALSGAQVTNWTFDAIGNMATRVQAGVTNTYNYNASGVGSQRPHAVASVSGEVNGTYLPLYNYDANGNLGSGAARIVAWTSSNMARTITSGAKQVSFYYTPERGRINETSTVSGSLQRTTTYINADLEGAPFYQEDSGVAGVSKKHYVNVGGSTVAVIVCTAAPCTTAANTTTQYWHEDHLGSVTAVTDQAGAVIERMAYEPFGKRRNSNGVTDSNGTLVPSSTAYGFTDQEHIDELGLINMNGRIYDPALGRFVSSDPTVPHPESGQSYNRYSYGRNNPLRMVDPSGFDDGDFGGFGQGSSWTSSFSSPNWGTTFGGSPLGGSLFGFSLFGGGTSGFSLTSADQTFAFTGAYGDPILRYSATGPQAAFAPSAAVNAPGGRYVDMLSWRETAIIGAVPVLALGLASGLSEAGSFLAFAASEVSQVGAVGAYLSNPALYNAAAVGTIGLAAEIGAGTTSPGGVAANAKLGAAFEAQQLKAIGNVPKETRVWRPSDLDVDSAFWGAAVGPATKTPGGLWTGIIVDALPQGAMVEFKGGSSVLNSTYQMRLEVYRSVVENRPLTIITNRPPNPSFLDYLNFWGGTIKKP